MPEGRGQYQADDEGALLRAQYGAGGGRGARRPSTRATHPGPSGGGAPGPSGGARGGEGAKGRLEDASIASEGGRATMPCPPAASYYTPQHTKDRYYTGVLILRCVWFRVFSVYMQNIIVF